MNLSRKLEASVPAYTGNMPAAMVARLRPKFPDARVIASFGGREIRQCDVPNCDGLVMDGTRCNKCREELAALDCLAVERELKKHDRVERRERVTRSAMEIGFVVWDWLKRNAVDYVLILFIAWAISYVFVMHGLELHDWLDGLAGK